MTPATALTVVTLGVADMRRSIAFYNALGLTRRMKATGDDMAFFAAGGVVLGLWSWASLAEDAGLAAAMAGYAFAVRRSHGIAPRRQASMLPTPMP